MNNKYTANILAQKLEPIFQRYKPELVYFFGSAYNGKTGPLSDIDLAILWKKETAAPMMKSLDIQNFIQDHLNDSRFEVGCLNNQNLSFCYNVISFGICIFGKEEKRVAYETEILSQYLDFNYLAEEYNQIINQKILKGF